jgi:hypothetical protein
LEESLDCCGKGGGMIPPLHMADLILSRSDTLLSKLIRFFEKEQTGDARVSHAALALGPFHQSPAVIEQLWTMQISPIKKYENQKLIIYRNSKWSHVTKHNICVAMMTLMNQPYGLFKIPLNALDAITGTFWFTSHLGITRFKTCAQAIAWSCYKATGEDNVFGCGWRSVTPDIQDDWCRGHPDVWSRIELT